VVGIALLEMCGFTPELPAVKMSYTYSIYNVLHNIPLGSVINLHYNNTQSSKQRHHQS